MNWIDFYMGVAFVVSQKSPDEETQHGCVIFDKRHRPISFGYNGFPRGARDKELPTKRPEKYPWMFHAEANAIANAQIRPDNCIAVVTGEPCNHCLYTLWQHGIVSIFYADRHGSYTITDEDRQWRHDFIEQTGIRMRPFQADLKWLIDIGVKVNTKDFFNL